MSLREVTDDTVAALEKAFPDLEFSADQKAEVASLIEDALRETVSHAAKAHQQATAQCCGPEADLAHQINQESKRATDLLVSNLMNLR